MKLSDIHTFVVGNPPPHYGGRYFVFVKLISDGQRRGHRRGLLRAVRSASGGEADRGRVRALPARRGSARHRTALAACLLGGFHAASGSDADGRVERARDGLLGHHRQGGRRAGLQAARRPRARTAAQLHLYLCPPGRSHAMSTWIPIWPPSARTSIWRRASPRSSSIRPDPTAPSTAGSSAWTDLERCERFCSCCARRSAPAPTCCSAPTDR